MKHVVIDRTMSDVPLFNGAFAESVKGDGYGLFEQWIPRMGNFISRRTGEEAFIGDALVIICPKRSGSPKYRKQLMEYVKKGGNLLVLDSPDVEGSTANSLLWSFGLESKYATQPSSASKLKLRDGGPEVPLSASCKISGGEPLAWLGDMPVAARVRYGEGTVTAIGFGSLFNDASMGQHWLPEPSAETVQRYEVLYVLLRASLPTTR